MLVKKRTSKQVEAICRTIYQRVLNGEVQNRVLTELKVGANSYSRYKRKFESSGQVIVHRETKEKRKYTFKDKKPQTQSKAFMFVGTPSELFAVMRELV